jgi:hypothetical protein
MKDGKIAKIEAELFAINFKYHKHDPSKVDYILACFAKELEVEGVPVISLNNLWIYEPSPISPLPAEGPLMEDELKLLSIIKANGSIEISSLCSGEFSGNRSLFMRISPEFIKSLHRGKIEDNIINCMSPEAKKYIKKYHHILVGGNISERACEILEILNKRGLIKIRPISFLSALYDGTLIEHDGWIPTEIYLTPIAEKYHNQTIIDYHITSLRNNIRTTLNTKIEK